MIDVAPTILEAAGLPEPVSVNGIAAGADRRRQHAVLVQRREGGRAARDAVLRDVRQPRHLPQGLDGGDAAHVRPGSKRQKAPAFDDDVWELYDTSKDWSQANDLAKENAGEARRAAAAVADRGDALQRAAARRPVDREDQSRHRRPAGLDQGQHAAPLRRHGTPVGELRPEHQEQVALRHRRDRACPRRAPRA